MKKVKTITDKMVLFVGLPIASVMKVTANYPVAFSTTKLAQSAEEYETTIGTWAFKGRPSDPEVLESIEKKLEALGIGLFRVSGLADEERDYVGIAKIPIMGAISKQHIESIIAHSIEILKKIFNFKPNDIQYIIFENEAE